MRDAAALVSQVQDERLRVQKQAAQVDEREKRLAEEMRLLDTSRRKRMVEDASCRPSFPRQSSKPPPVVVMDRVYRNNNNSFHHDQRTARVPPVTFGDPCGLSPSFRAEMEQFWRQGNHVKPEQLHERMVLSCLGLPTKHESTRDRHDTKPRPTMVTPTPPLSTSFML
ncbi:Aste57867_2589 [Aphanomyces stellatus]|uniref:Aste57867_2589 protein n=1 Tax=Aphanomyces stellatus TaxID=120398 RepID=A0A485KBM4_9STRA|nr:hypothetical protein As57867_002582 [Aphanomyces stellatus]VFT79785.1 Aste57867_2589 [Aphanomyces stellatus]